MPSISSGFCVAITKKGLGSGRLRPVMVTWRSAMASSRADWVLGVARLISSASSSWVNTGPSRNTSLRVPVWGSSSRMWVPTMSAGMRSGVNWTRL